VSILCWAPPSATAGTVFEIADRINYWKPIRDPCPRLTALRLLGEPFPSAIAFIVSSVFRYACLMEIVFPDSNSALA
jgi:hypothetical protein